MHICTHCMHAYTFLGLNCSFQEIGPNPKIDMVVFGRTLIELLLTTEIGLLARREMRQSRTAVEMHMCVHL